MNTQDYVYIGIDPGMSGAISFLYEDGRDPVVIDMPTIATEKSKGGTKNELNAPVIAKVLRDHVAEFTHVYVAIEKVQAMPAKGKGGERRSMGATSAFSFGEGYGVLQGVIGALGLSLTRVHPATWKKKILADAAKGKGASRLRAAQLFPKIASQFARVKDDGRAEALLIADWLRREMEIPF